MRQSLAEAPRLSAPAPGNFDAADDPLAVDVGPAARGGGHLPHAHEVALVERPRRGRCRLRARGPARRAGRRASGRR